MPGAEAHFVKRAGWLRAAVLGANDGIISTASLVVGVAAGSHSAREVLLAGVAALVAGATAMAAGEYVSVHSQADMEMADIAREKRELVEKPEFELDELTRIYIDRGVEPELARQVSQQMMAHDALGTHVRDELGFSPQIMARPIQAAIASAATFACGAALPLIAALLADGIYRPNRLRDLSGRTCRTRSTRRPCRESEHRPARYSGDILGRLRDGGDGHHRCTRRACGVAFARQTADLNNKQSGARDHEPSDIQTVHARGFRAR